MQDWKRMFLEIWSLLPFLLLAVTQIYDQREFDGFDAFKGNFALGQ